MNLGRGLIFIILLVFVLSGVYMYYLGTFQEMDLNEVYYDEFSFISSNYSYGYVNDPSIAVMRSYLDENDVEGHNYILGDSYSGVVLDSVMLDKLEVANYSVVSFGGRDFVVSEFPYKNQYSFYVGDIRDKYNIEKYEKVKNISLENRTILYDSISNKIVYLHY